MDAEEILEDETENVQAIFCRAESLFNLCQFERSLCAFYKGKVLYLLERDSHFILIRSVFFKSNLYVLDINLHAKI